MKIAFVSYKIANAHSVTGPAGIIYRTSFSGV